MIRLPATPTLSKIEECLSSIRSAPNADLWLPTNVSTAGLFGWACLHQAIITWARSRGNGAIVVETDHPSQANLVERVAHKPHGWIASLVAERIQSRVGVDQTLLFRDAIAQELRNRQQPTSSTSGQALLPGMESDLSGNLPKRRGGLSVELCADGLGILSTPRSLYSFRAGVPVTRGASEFGDWAMQEFTQLSKKGALQTGRVDLPGLADVGRAVSELFSNTHKWGRTEVDGSWIRRSVRGILTDAVRDVSQRFKVEEPAPIRDFLDGIRSRFGRTQSSGAMEISVFDSGQGLAQHWLGKPLNDAVDINLEREAVTRCLQKWGTTGGSESRGIGLHTVMANLSKPEVGGLLLIRTGRLSLYRDLSRDPLADSDHSPAGLAAYRMNDLYSQRLSRVEGTLISMIIPTPLISA